MKDLVRQRFRSEYGMEPSHLIRAPGRVNLIGEHTDYNGGFVLPMAIEYAVWIAMSMNQDDSVSIFSDNYNQSKAYTTEVVGDIEKGWGGFVQGTIQQLTIDKGVQKGWKGVVVSDLPVGAGLSSSAALEVALIKAFQLSTGFPASNKEIALLGQKVENRWIGVNCGIMDQLASACGRKGHSLFIDCRSLDLKTVPIPGGCTIAILDTTTRRKLEGSAYNERRVQCENVCCYYGIPYLRDLSLEQLQEDKGKLEWKNYLRALHVVTENKRTCETAELLKAGNLKKAGQMLSESHESLRDNYEVSSEALNQIVESAATSTGCFGARMTGAGFGGCAVALVETRLKEQFSEEVMKRYQAASGMEARVYLSKASAGVDHFIVNPTS